MSEEKKHIRGNASPLRSERAGAWYAILSAVLFGTMPFFAKIAYSYGFNSFSVAFGRFLFGAAGAAVIIAVTPGLSFRVSRREFRTLILLSVFYAVTPVLLYSSYYTISSGLCTTLHFTYPIVVMVLGAALFHRGLRRRDLVCLVICLAGVICFYRPGGNEGTEGMILAVTSGFTYAVYIVLLGESPLKKRPVMTTSFWISILASAGIFVFAAVTGNLVFAPAWHGWAAIGCLGVVATVLGLSLFQLGVALCGGVKSSLLSTFEPLTSILLGVVIFHEGMTPRIVLGIVLILVSTVLLVYEPSREADPGEEH